MANVIFKVYHIRKHKETYAVTWINSKIADLRLQCITLIWILWNVLQWILNDFADNF